MSSEILRRVVSKTLLNGLPANEDSDLKEPGFPLVQANYVNMIESPA